MDFCLTTSARTFPCIQITCMDPSLLRLATFVNVVPILIQVKKFPSKFEDKQSLKDVLSKLLWLASGYHAAVTFPQLEFSGFLPNAPYRLFADDDNNDVFSNRMFGNKVKALVSYPGLLISMNSSQLYSLRISPRNRSEI